VEELLHRTNILVLASHVDALIREMCNRTILLDHGRLVADGKPDDVIAEYHDMLKRMEPPKLTVAEDAPAFT